MTKTSSVFCDRNVMFKIKIITENGDWSNMLLVLSSPLDGNFVPRG